MTTRTWISADHASPGRLSDGELLARVRELTRCERATTAELVAHLAELDARRLYLQEGCASLFAYCTRILHLSEHAAFTRITAARLSRRLPGILRRLEDGSIHLTTLRLLGPHLTRENCGAVLDEARHRSKREVEEIVARVAPRPDVASRVRKLPGARVAPRGEEPAAMVGMPEALSTQRAMPGGPAGAGAGADHEARPRVGPTRTDVARAIPTGVEPAVLETPPVEPPRVGTPRLDRATATPLSPGRYRVQFTADAATHAKIREAQDLLRREIPDGDVAAIVDRALDRLLEILRPRTNPRARAGRPADRRARVAGTHATDMAGRGDSIADSDASVMAAGGASTAAGAAAASAGTAAAPATLPARVTARPSRHIPAAVRRAVWTRDRGRCAFVGRNGHRCGERAFLELHHVTPFAVGGGSTVANLRLLCRAHNGLESTRWYGLRADGWRNGPPGAPIVQSPRGGGTAAAAASQATG